MIFMPFGSVVLQLRYSSSSSPFPQSHHSPRLSPSSSFPLNGSSIFSNLASAAGLHHFLFDCHGRGYAANESSGDRDPHTGAPTVTAAAAAAGVSATGEEGRTRRRRRLRESSAISFVDPAELQSWKLWEKVAENEMHSDDAVTALVGDANRLHVTLEGVAHHIYSSDRVTSAMLDPEGKGFVTSIPGSVLHSQQDVERFQNWSRGVAVEGSWVRDPTPRKFGWPKLKPDDATCEERHVRGGGIAWEEADAVADEWESYAAKHAGEEGTAGYQQAKEKLERAWRVRESLKYVWRPKDGSLPWRSMNGKDLCAFATDKGDGNKSFNLLVLGDSINEVFTVSLVGALSVYGKKPAHDLVQASTVPECVNLEPGICDATNPNFCAHYKIKDESVCANGTSLNVIFLRHYYLHISSRLDKAEYTPWSRMQGLLKWANVIVINRGAHLTRDEDYKAGIRAALRFIRIVVPSTLLIVRGTPHGHLNCSNYKAPISQPLEQGSLPWGWKHFAYHSALAEEEAVGVGAVYLDVLPMSSLRPDGYREVNRLNATDCLHYCVPGPVDGWAQLLLNVLLRLLPSSQA